MLMPEAKASGFFHKEMVQYCKMNHMEARK